MPDVIHTICQMCYFYCGIQVTVDGGRILRIDGQRNHPVNHGRLCAKALAAAQLATDPNRLKTPLRRIGDRGENNWQEISWKQAIEEIAQQMATFKQRHGAETMGFYRGHAPGWVTNYNYVLRLMNAWGSSSVFTHANLCFLPRAIAHSATFGGFPEPDYDQARAILLIGYNPVSTSPVNYAPRIIWAKERGAKLIVIDPRFTHTAAKADLFLQPRPGTTGPLVLAMIQTIIDRGWYDDGFIRQWTVGFERLKRFVRDYRPQEVAATTWVPAETIVEAARIIATVKPALVVDGNGLDQQPDTVQTVRTTSILRGLIRSVDEPGGSVLIPPLPAEDVALRGSRTPDLDEPEWKQYPLYFNLGQTMGGTELTDAIAATGQRRLRGLIVQGGNPASVLSQSATVRQRLKELDFLVVHDLYPTATARLADIVLPAASFLERDLVLHYRYRPFVDGNLVAMQNRCVPPVGQSRPDIDFLFALARGLGLREIFPWEDAIQAFDWELAYLGIDTQWLREHPEGFIRRFDPGTHFQKYRQTGFATPSGKIEFYSSLLEAKGLDPLPVFADPGEPTDDYPFICSAGLKLGVHTHTQFHSLPWIREMEPGPFAEIHPRTAARLDIADGDRVRILSPSGAVTVQARVRATVHPRVVMVTFGYGEPYAGLADPVNAITSEKTRDPFSGATNNRSFPVDIQKVEETGHGS